MSYVIGFLPWIVFAILSASNNPSREQLILAAAAAFVIAVITSVPAAKKHLIGSIEIGGLVFFPIMILLAVIFPPLQVDKWSSALLGAGLTIAVGAGIMVGKPFTLMYAKAQVPEVLWTNPYFIASNKKMSIGWFYGFVLLTISSIISGFFVPATTIYYVFAWVIPTIIMVIIIFWQNRLIAEGRARGAAREKERTDRVIAEGDRVVDFLDHVTTRLTIEDARRTCAALGSLGLVHAWQFSDYGAFASGGIRFGNLNIELLGVSEAGDSVIPQEFVTFEPISLHGLLPELERRGLHPGELDTQKHGDLTIYTRIPLEDMQDEQYATQLCVNFGATRTFQPEAPANSAGIVKVREVRLGVSAAMKPRWSELVAPIDTSGSMNFGQGPFVSLLSADDDQVDLIIVEVEDVNKAATAFAGAGLETSGSSVRIGSLTLELVSNG